MRTLFGKMLLTCSGLIALLALGSCLSDLKNPKISAVVFFDPQVSGRDQKTLYANLSNIIREFYNTANVGSKLIITTIPNSRNPILSDPLILRCTESLEKDKRSQFLSGNALCNMGLKPACGEGDGPLNLQGKKDYFGALSILKNLDEVDYVFFLSDMVQRDQEFDFRACPDQNVGSSPEPFEVAQSKQEELVSQFGMESGKAMRIIVLPASASWQTHGECTLNAINLQEFWKAFFPNSADCKWPTLAPDKWF